MIKTSRKPGWSFFEKPQKILFLMEAVNTISLEKTCIYFLQPSNYQYRKSFF